MAQGTTSLARLKERIQAQNGTVLERVEGVVELADTDDQGQPRLGPVLVLRSIEAGAQLKLAHPRPVTVLGTLSGQVFGAYRVKAGNLLSGRLEGVRHVEIVHHLGSQASSNEDAWIIFEATSDPGFFQQAQQGLVHLRQLEACQQPQREASAQQGLLRTLKNVPYDIKVFVPGAHAPQTVFALRPARGGIRIQLDLQRLLHYLVGQVERRQAEAGPQDLRQTVEAVLRDQVCASLQQANSGGIGAALRKQTGSAVFADQVEVICAYLVPKLLHLWLKVSQRFVQQRVDQLSAAPMILKVDGQLAPFFQIEYPHWQFHVSGQRIRSRKLADCNLAAQLGDDPHIMQLTYSYVSDDDWISQTCQIPLDQTRACRLILQDGAVFLSDRNHPLFGPNIQTNSA
jgi:hypothetical protein